jgi:hypothetical protein
MRVRPRREPDVSNWHARSKPLDLRFPEQRRLHGVHQRRTGSTQSSGTGGVPRVVIAKT